MNKIIAAVVAIIACMGVSSPVQAAPEDVDTPGIEQQWDAALLSAKQEAGVFARPAATRREKHCHEEFRAKEDHANDGSPGRDEWWIRIGHGYRVCKRVPGRDFVVPQYKIAAYNFEGTEMNCGAGWNVMRFLRSNTWIQDSLGFIVNPPRHDVPCDESTRNVATQVYSRADKRRLYYVRGVSPLAEDNWRVHKGSAPVDIWEPSGFIQMRLTKDGKTGN